MNDNCRLCRKNYDGNFTSLFSLSDGLEVRRKVVQVCQITIENEPQETFPKSICDDCLEIVNSAYNLQRLSLESDSFFRSLLPQALIKKEEPTDKIFYEHSNVKYENPSESDDEKSDASEPLLKKHKTLQTKFDIKLNFTVQGTSTSSYYSCNFCETKLNCPDEMMKHIEDSHDPFTQPFPCRFCVHRFITEKERNIHEKKDHSGWKPSILLCDICGATGNNKEGMRIHTQGDHGTSIKPLSNTRAEKSQIVFKNNRIRAGVKKRLRNEAFLVFCNFCEERIERESIKDHVSLMHNPAMLPFGCRFCVTRFKNENDILLHEAQKHIGQFPLTLFCDICGVTSMTKDGMQRHLMRDHRSMQKKSESNNNKYQPKYKRKDDGSFDCDRCQENFTDVVALRKHILLSHDNQCRELPSEKVLHEKKCCACLKEFSSSSAVLNHLATHRDMFKKLACAHKIPKVKTFTEFVSHCEYHLKPKTHECLHCKKLFPVDLKFITHLKGHKQIYNQRNVGCQKCGSKFRSKGELAVHDKVKHQNLTLFICPFCAKSMCSKSSLDTHIKFIHKQEKSFHCKVCKAKFSLRSHLIRHDSTHKIDRPHVCELCGQTFKINEGLKIHLKRHNGTFLKKFDCNQCSVKFTSKNRLQVHMLTHTGAKPYECQYCDRAYTSKGDLTKHLQKLHVGNAVYKCEKCTCAFPKIVELREHLLVHAE